MRIEMFGGLRVQIGEASLRLRSRQAETLLAILALSPGRNFSRAELAERLWPSAPPETAHSRFKQELSSLRRTLVISTNGNSGLLLGTSEGLCLATSNLTTDVSDFKASLLASQSLSNPLDQIHALEKAILFVRGPLLPGNYDPHLLQKRERLTQIYGEALHQLARLYAAEGELLRAVQAARSAVQSDPLQEELRCDLIRFYLRSGRPQDAQSALDDYTELLMQELGEAPTSNLLILAQHAQRFAMLGDANYRALRSLSPMLHKLLCTIAHRNEAGKLSEFIDAADPPLLEQLAQLHEFGLLQSASRDGVMHYRLLPELELLNPIPSPPRT